MNVNSQLAIVWLLTDCAVLYCDAIDRLRVVTDARAASTNRNDCHSELPTPLVGHPMISLAAMMRLILLHVLVTMVTMRMLMMMIMKTRRMMRRATMMKTLLTRPMIRMRRSLIQLYSHGQLDWRT